MRSIPLEAPSARGLVGKRHGKIAEARNAGLWSLFRRHRRSTLLTYGLFSLENLLALARPWALGLAIDGLLRASYREFVVLAAQYVAFGLLGTLRQMVDTWTFTRIHADLASELVLQQRGMGVETSRVAARSALSREIVDFFEHNVPYIVQSVYLVVGSLAMLALCDGWMVPACLALLTPIYGMSAAYARQCYGLNQRLNDRLEVEVEIIAGACREEVHRHYAEVRRLRVRLSNCQAINFGLLQGLLLGLVSTALLRCCVMRPVDTGQIFAVLGYATMFAAGVGNTPALVQQLSRLRDITRRVA